MEQHIAGYLTGSFGRTLSFYEEIDSTNTAAKLLAKNGLPHGAVVAAARQTAGKGRQGRSFDSPTGAGVYLSVVVRPALPAAAAMLLTPAAAVAVSRAIEKICGVQIRIKWVNDLYYEGKKLCGILTESAVKSDGTLDWAVVGIGVNTKEVKRPPALQNKITSLEAAGAQIEPAQLIAEILNELEPLCAQLETKEFLNEYRVRSCVLGRRVVVLQGEQQIEAEALEITDDAALVVRTQQGKRLVLNSGEISLRGDFGG